MKGMRSSSYVICLQSSDTHHMCRMHISYAQIKYSPPMILQGSLLAEQMLPMLVFVVSLYVVVLFIQCN